MKDIQIIRYANEGFNTYNTKIKVEGEVKEVNGCFAFIRKSFKGALIYNYPVYDKDGNILKNRDKDKKHTLKLKQNTKVYGRIPNINNIYFINSGRRIQLDDILNDTYKIKSKTIHLPYKLNWCYTEDFAETTLGELNNALIEFENLLKIIKGKGYRIVKSEPLYTFYEIYIDKDNLNNY